MERHSNLWQRAFSQAAPHHRGTTGHHDTGDNPLTLPTSPCVSTSTGLPRDHVPLHVTAAIGSAAAAPLWAENITALATMTASGPTDQ
jgi:hypothetical protein